MAQACLVPWAQYWAWWLSGTAVSEVTSLGCHSDLWSPDAADWSPLAKAQGWDQRFAPLAKAGDVIGTISPALAAATGLPATVKVLAGLHDSNAALMAARGFAEIAEFADAAETKLSRRQLQLLLMLDQGLSNRNIADQLQISEHTVKVHLWRLFRRINVKSRTQAVHHARTHGMLTS